MQTYNLKSLATNKKGTTVLFPVIPESAGMQRSYLAALRKVIAGMAEGVKDIIIPAFETRKLTMDADPGSYEAFEALAASLAKGAIRRFEVLVGLEAKRHTESFHGAARKTFGVDLNAVLAEGDLSDYIDQAALRNAGLIKGMTDDLIKKVKLLTTNALINGKTANQLRAEIKETLKVSDKRAKLIARDQTSKINAELTKLRHKQAEIEEYIWRTSKDERVRERHAKLEGKKYKYDEPTGAEQGLEPGQPVQCRCIAQAIVEF